MPQNVANTAHISDLISTELVSVLPFFLLNENTEKEERNWKFGANFRQACWKHVTFREVGLMIQRKTKPQPFIFTVLHSWHIDFILVVKTEIEKPKGYFWTGDCTCVEDSLTICLDTEQNRGDLEVGVAVLSGLLPSCKK